MDYMICIYLNYLSKTIGNNRFYFMSFLLNTNIPSPTNIEIPSKLDNNSNNTCVLLYEEVNPITDELLANILK